MDFQDALNKHLGNTRIVNLEDPAEDVFITNIETPEGNRRVFEGIWDSTDYFVQIVLQILSNRKAPNEWSDLLVQVFALLAISDCVAERISLQRWHSEPSQPSGKVRLAPATRVADRARAITFTDSELGMLGVSRNILAPFIFRNEDKQAIAEEAIGHSSLERRPIVDFDGELVLALPHAVGSAIRRFVLSEMLLKGSLQMFSDALAALQARQTERDGLRELKEKTESLQPPAPDGKDPPSLFGWLLKYDINKYLHVLLLNDRLDKLEAHGLSSFMEYSQEEMAGLEEYIGQVSGYCQSLPDFAEGMTLVVMGGLGRGFFLGFRNWPDQWRLSVIKIPDLLMLANETDEPIKRYLKFIKQKEWAEQEGVYFQNINGDYDFYCFWRRQSYQLVPRSLAVRNGSIILIGTDVALPVRKEVRSLVDHHVVQTTTGSYEPVMRFGRDVLFKSMQDRPIYVALDLLHSGTLAGVVETSRGASWFTIKPHRRSEKSVGMLYEMWSGFISLYDRMVVEVEALYPNSPVGAIEIFLDFGETDVPEEYLEYDPGVDFGEPEVSVNLGQRSAEVKFPPKFFLHFQKPENTGERLVLNGIAKGLVSLHLEVEGKVEEAVLEMLLDRVIGDPNMRLLHLFHTYDPVEHLLARQSRKPIFLADEDFVFSKLRLSESCTSTQPSKGMESKTECSDFLNKVVDKVWLQLREQLQRLNRASVIRDVLEVHEAIFQDRDYWRRTAQAVLSLSMGRLRTSSKWRGKWNRNGAMFLFRLELSLRWASVSVRKKVAPHSLGGS